MIAIYIDHFPVNLTALGDSIQIFLTIIQPLASRFCEIGGSLCL